MTVMNNTNYFKEDSILSGMEENQKRTDFSIVTRIVPVIIPEIYY